MEYILLILFCLVCGACVLAVFLESEVQTREITYKKRELKNS